MNKIKAALSSLQQAGITETEFRSANLLLRELPDASLFRLRSLQPEITAAALLAKGLESPLNTGGSMGADPAILCLRPGEWLAYATSPQGTELHDRLLDCLADGESAGQAVAVDMSDGLAALQLSGAAAPWLLAKLSSLDFFGNRDSGQYCARTRMGQVAVVVNYHAPTASPAECAYDLILERSITAYLWDLMVQSAGHAEELRTGSYDS